MTMEVSFYSYKYSFFNKLTFWRINLKFSSLPEFGKIFKEPRKHSICNCILIYKCLYIYAKFECTKFYKMICNNTQNVSIFIIMLKRNESLFKFHFFKDLISHKHLQFIHKNLFISDSFYLSERLIREWKIHPFQS